MPVSAERRPPVPSIPGIQKGTEGVTSKRESGGGISVSESLQVRERIRGKRPPLFIIKATEENQWIWGLWKIPGTVVRVSPEGDIFYPFWKERSRISNPEDYSVRSKLPGGWSEGRLLASVGRPVSEIIFLQVKKDGGAVETAIRAMDHVLEGFRNKGKELQQVVLIETQINQAINVLKQTQSVPKEEFERGFGILYQQTLDLLEKSGMSRAGSALKKDIARLLEEASKGKDRLGRRNPVAMMKKLEAAAKRVSYRRSETGFIIDKFEAMKAGLMAQREKDRAILERARHELKEGLASHEVFKHSRIPTGLQQGFLLGKIGTLIYYLEQTKVKCYKPVAVEAVQGLEKAREMIRQKDYQNAQGVFSPLIDRLSRVLD